MAAEAAGLPGLTLTAGPSSAGADSGSGTTATGAFYFGQPQPGLLQKALPWIIGGAVAWYLLK